MWESIPTVVALVTFLFRSYVLGQELTAAEGFTGLMLFSLLKQPLMLFPDMIGWGIQALVAVRRIEGFLAESNIAGFNNNQSMPLDNRKLDPNNVSKYVGTISFCEASFSWVVVPKNENETEETEKTSLCCDQSFEMCKLLQHRCYQTQKWAFRVGQYVKSVFSFNSVQYSALNTFGDADDVTGLELGEVDECPTVEVREQLHNITTNIPSGCLVAIVGPTGSLYSHYFYCLILS